MNSDTIEILVNQGNRLFVDEDYSAAVKCFDLLLSPATASALPLDTRVQALLSRAACHQFLSDDLASYRDALEALRLDAGQPAAYFRKGVAAFHLGEHLTAQLAFETGLRLAQASSAHLHLPWDAWIRKTLAEASTECDREAGESEGDEEEDGGKALADDPVVSHAATSTLMHSIPSSSSSSSIASSKSSSSSPSSSSSSSSSSITPSSSSSSSSNSPSSSSSSSTTLLDDQSVEAQVEQLKAKGNAEFAAKQYREALQHYTAALALDPKHVTLYLNRAAAYAQLRWHQRAIEDAQRTLQLDPSSIKGHWRLGSSQLANRAFREAQAAFSSGLKIEPGNAALRQGLLVCQFAARYPALSSADAAELLDGEGQRLPVTRVFEIVRHNVALMGSLEVAQELRKTIRQLSDGWVVTGKMSISEVAQLAPFTNMLDFNAPAIRVLCKVSEAQQVYSYTYNKPEDVSAEESANPALRRMSSPVNLNQTQKTILDVTFSEIKRSCQSNPALNKHILGFLKK